MSADGSGDRAGTPRPADGPGFWRLLVRYGLVGLLNTAFGYAVFIVLQLTLGRVVHYLVVLVAANVVAILQAYIFQRRLVFRFTGGWWAGLGRFALVYLGAFAANLVLLPALHELGGIPVIPAQGIATVVQAFGTFVAHRLFTFRSPGDAAADGAALAWRDGDSPHSFTGDGAAAVPSADWRNGDSPHSFTRDGAAAVPSADGPLSVPDAGSAAACTRTPPAAPPPAQRP